VSYQHASGERREREYGATFRILCPNCGKAGLRRYKQSGDVVTLWCVGCPRFIEITFARYGVLISWHFSPDDSPPPDTVLHGPFKTQAEIKESQRVTLLGPAMRGQRRRDLGPGMEQAAMKVKDTPRAAVSAHNKRSKTERLGRTEPISAHGGLSRRSY
jgi:hypothetical protein